MSRSESLSVLRQFDSRADGRISKDDFHTGLQKMGMQPLGVVELDALMLMVETDAEGMVLYTEFLPPKLEVTS